MKYWFALLASLLFFTNCRHAAPPPTAVLPPIPEGERPRNVILLIGDGMGLTQVSAGLYSNNNHLNLEQCTATGLIKTYSASHLVTDSGAGATAFACGCKTYNTAIGVDKNKKPCRTLLEQAEAKDMATGLAQLHEERSMTETVEFALRAVLIGAGATGLMDGKPIDGVRLLPAVLQDVQGAADMAYSLGGKDGLVLPAYGLGDEIHAGGGDDIVRHGMEGGPWLCKSGRCRRPSRRRPAPS